MDTEQYIEHEVQLRLLNSELKLMQKNFDDKFDSMQSTFNHKIDLVIKNFDDKLDNRFKSLWSIGVLIMGLLMPVFLKSIGVL